MRMCLWERHEYAEKEFGVRGGVTVHVAAGQPWHTAGGQLFEPGGIPGLDVVECVDEEIEDDVAAANDDRQQS